jgi:plastocyanin
LRKLPAVLAAVPLLVAFAAVGSGSATGSSVRAAASKSVKVGDDFFKPARLTVSRGTTVVWTWKGKNRHSVTEINSRFGSKVKRKGTYKHRFAKKGKFTIYCKVHPIDMRAKVIVK